MTETTIEVDLDDYHRTLGELNDEIAAYGSQRSSLGEIAGTLTELHRSSRRMFSACERSLATGSAVLGDLKAMNLPELQMQISDRYETHQQALASMSTALEQAVREQQRAGLEMLQNAEHTKRELEHYSAQVDAAFATYAEQQNDIAQQLQALASGHESMSKLLGSITTEVESLTTGMTDHQKQIRLVQSLLVVAVVLILSVGALTFLR